ncbi:hypothetical protein [Marisediminicola senii]|uniref:hypothetical protein n=1 Tax=Marisediminicola senii TaxID=2711233 RepID=UPI0013EBC2AD|nr:hypothetical protein [Marisediminicola senii]
MKLHTVVIGTHVFTLPSDVDLPALQDSLTDTVLRGGGIVRIPSIDAEEVSVLVSPGLPMIFRERLLPEADSDGAENGNVHAIYWDDIDGEFS